MKLLLNFKLLTIAVFLFLIYSISYANAFYKYSTDIQHDIFEVYNKFKNNNGGKNANYIPILTTVDPDLFAIVVLTVDGRMFSVGDADKSFAIESISKPFVYALAMQDNGEDFFKNKLSLNATGNRFNSVIAIEEQAKHLQNPLVNAGAIQVTSFIKGKNSDIKWQRVLNFMGRLSGENLQLGNEYYKSESVTNQHNLSIAYLLASYDLITSDPRKAVDRYTKACSILVTAKQLAKMGAVLANGGIHPFTHERVIAPNYVRNTLAQMVTNGMYENSGAWWAEVGIPSKSGVGGGVLAVVPNKMAIVVLSPRLDDSGNSVKGQLVVKELSKRWKLHQLMS